jgi:hypothetical protein
MIDSLKRHFFDNNIAYTEINAFGIKYIIEGKIETPDKRNPMIRSVWIIENYDEIIKFVTAYPI